MSRHQHVKYLLIGGGLASSAAAKAIRNSDKDGSIYLLAQESSRPYHRPALSKDYLRGLKSREDLFTDFVGWFKENHIDLHTGSRAIALDVNRKCVSIETGDEIQFDKLLIATGASPIKLTVPGAQLANLFYLRNLEDADRLKHAIELASGQLNRRDNNLNLANSVAGESQPVKHGRVVVVGAGMLGVEIAATLAAIGLHVELIASGPHPWNRICGETAGNIILRAITDHHITTHLNSQVAALEGDGRLQRVRLADGKVIACDFAIAAIGITPNRELLRNTPINSQRAILTDEHCQTNIPDIYAAGDCAAVFDPLFNRHRQLDHWESAAFTGTIAGRNMAGAKASFDIVSHFSSDLLGLTLHVYGDHRHVDHRIIRNIGTTDVIEFGINSEGRITQALSLSQNPKSVSLRALVRSRLDVSGKEEQLRDPKVGIDELLP